MDCRKGIVLVLLAGMSCMGCQLFKRDQQPAPPPLTQQVKNKQSAPLTPPPSQNRLTSFLPGGNSKKRRAKAATEISFAKFQERESQSKNCGPLQRERKLENARKAYTRALEIEPKNIDAALGVARVYGMLGNHQKAMAAYASCRANHPDKGQVWYELGMYHARRKEFTPALTCLEKAIKAEPDNRLYAKTLGLCQARAGRTQESVRTLSQLMGPGKAHLNVARMMFHLKQPTKADMHLRIALQQNQRLAGTAQVRDLQVKLGKGSQQPSGVVNVNHRGRGQSGVRRAFTRPNLGAARPSPQAHVTVPSRPTASLGFQGTE